MSGYAEERLLRPPLIQGRPDTAEPLTVLFSLLSRADNTALAERRLTPGHTLDQEGQPILDPSNEASENGFERNPNLHFEHWGEYWRKVHGVRFTHVEETDDLTLERLVRYEQLHRFAPGPTHTDSPPYRAPVDPAGKLWPTVIGHVEPYRRPRWDGVAYLSFATPDDIGVVFANQRVREKILPEDRAMFRDLAPVLARQYVILASATGNEAVTLVKLHTRRKGSDRDAFQRWWKDEHAKWVMQQIHSDGYVKRYAQLHSIGPVEEGAPFYHPDASQIDGVSLLSFSSVSDVEDFLRSPAHARIAAHEANEIDHEASEFWTTIRIGVVNRIHPELVTR